MTADTVGGVWTYVLELARSLQSYGVEVALATMGRPLSPQQWEEAALLPRLQIFESEYRLEWMEQPWDDVERAGEWLLRLEDRIKPDLIHLNGYAHGSLPWDSPVLMVGHSCVLSWWSAVWGGDAPSEWDRYRTEVKRGIQAADLIVAPTAAMLDELERFYGPLPPCRVIPNARHADAFAPGEKEPFVFTAGRVWDDAKNVYALEHIADRLSWPVYVAGDPQHPDFGVSELQNVRTLGRLPPACLADWLSRASIYALPARYEPFGLSALEAAHCGCALVLGDIPTLREVWGDAALFVPPHDEEGLAEALNALAADPSRRREQADLARSRAMEYTPERKAEGYLQAYADLLRRKQGVGGRV